MNFENHDALGRQVLFAAISYSGPFAWSLIREPERRWLGHGTAFALDCGNGPFLVTAAHVVRGCMTDILEYKKGVVVQFGDAEFDLSEALIDIDDDQDLATLKITRQQIAQSERTVLTGSQSDWPPPPPQESKAVFFAGFPACGSYRVNSEAYSFGIYAAILRTTAVGPRNITLHIDPDDLDDFADLGLPTRGQDMAGISGAPLLSWVNVRGVDSWRLGGVIYESSQSLDVVFAARADFIGVDGKILRKGQV